MMKCENDTHDKEILCPWYESGKPKLSNCDCKFMDDDLCFSQKIYQNFKNHP
jgi:hypothetical protein